LAFPLRRTQDPLTEPITLVAAKNHLRVDIVDDDALIQAMISAARERVEDMIGRCLIEQEWTFALDRFPVWNYGAHDAPSHPSSEFLGNRGWGGMAYMNMGQTIILPRSPLIKVTSIQYLDGTKTLQTIDSSKYIVDTLSDPARITPQVGTVWPIAYPQLNAVTIKFTAGYQQEITETQTATADVSPAVTLNKADKLVSITSVTDTLTGDPVTYTNDLGTLTLLAAQSARAVTITYVVTSVPHPVNLAILLLLTAYYENRAEFTQGGGQMVSIPLGVDSLLAGYKSQLFGYIGGGY
jgi:hypothetical protein